MSTLKQRFALLAKERPEISQANLARATGAKPPSVNAWFSGDTKTMKADTAAKAAAVYGCNALWLATGAGPMWPGEAGPQATRPAAPAPAKSHDPIPNRFTTSAAERSVSRSLEQHHDRNDSEGEDHRSPVQSVWVLPAVTAGGYRLTSGRGIRVPRPSFLQLTKPTPPLWAVIYCLLEGGLRSL